MESTPTTMSLKLLIDTKGERVLFAEAGKDFVDFLFDILGLPVGAIIYLLREQHRVGSLANLYESIENLDNSYMQPKQSKDKFLKPVPNSPLPLLALHAAAPPPLMKEIYICLCKSKDNYYSDYWQAVCPNCGQQMYSSLSYKAPPAADGFVKDMVTCMVMDDLVVTPLSAISGITLLKKFNVKDFGAVEEKVVHFGVDEAFKLLNASLQSTKVLTEVFCKSIRSKTEDPE